MTKKKHETAIELIRGDVVKTLRQGIETGDMEGSADVIVTSPPYNIGKNYGDGTSDKRKPSQYLSWVDDWMRLLKVTLADDGSFFLNVGGTPKDPTLALRVMSVALSYFKVQNVIHWVKSATIPQGGTEKTVGHFKPINSERFLNDTHEYLLHLTHRGDVKLHRKTEGVGVHYEHASNVKRWAHTGGSNRRCRGNVWMLPYKTIQSSDKQRPHPATFPEELPLRAIKLHGGEDCSDLRVLDPFVGIGTTGVAAVRCHAKKFTGIDVDGGDFYLQEARRRIDEAKADFQGVAIKLT